VITGGRTDLTVAFRSSSCATPRPPAMLTTSAIVRHVAMRFPPLAISGVHDRVPTRLGTVELDLPDRVNRKAGQSPPVALVDQGRCPLRSHVRHEVRPAPGHAASARG
jgi:hypothetical protein